MDEGGMDGWRERGGVAGGVDVGGDRWRSGWRDVGIEQDREGGMCGEGWMNGEVEGGRVDVGGGGWRSG